jgi:hypothetical protein
MQQSLMRKLRSRATMLSAAAALCCQGCANLPPEAASGQAAPNLGHEAAEALMQETFARRDRTEYPYRDLVAPIVVREDRLEIQSSADGVTIICIFRQIGKFEYTPVFLTRIGELKITGCSREFYVYFWDDRDARNFVSAVNALKN